MQTRPHVVVAVGVVFTALSSIFIRLSDAPSLAIAAYRMVFTTILLSPLFLRERIRGRGAAGNEGAIDRGGNGGEAVRRTDGRRPGRAASPGAPPTLRGAVLLSLVSGVFLALHFAFWISSLSYTSVASSTVLVTTHPIIVGLLGFLLLGEHLSLRGVLAMLGALGGSVVLVWGGLGAGESVFLGNVLAFLGSVTVAGYMLLGRVVRRRLSVNAYTMIVYSVSALLLVAAAVVTGVPLYPYPLRELAIFIALAFFCTLLGHSLFNWALRYLQPTIISTSILGEPVIASLLALALFGEVPTPYTLVGAALILVGIYLFIRTDRKSVV